ncbi:hypothetical protein GIB67_024029 [Kingdonia uniflora]|uniref:Uncharacterized protein n=1 Tax=Kingdonia uniflora TaxID=39325 RepID=A0A7J7N5T5_9MAGN|nr:hypothetical protein GIB67_024029 [Kingdonia uniflora]
MTMNSWLRLESSGDCMPRFVLEGLQWYKHGVELNSFDKSMNYLIGAFKPPCHISVTFVDGKARKQVPLKKENGQTTMVPLFQSQENIVGEISIDPIQGKKVEHTGVKIELLGQIVNGSPTGYSEVHVALSKGPYPSCSLCHWPWEE